MAILQEISGPEPGRQFPLEGARTVLGRHPDCNIVIEVGAVSRHHAQVVMIDGEYYVEDLSSRNGTFVNDRLLHSRHRLAEDDRLRVCDVSFAFRRSLQVGGLDASDETSASAIIVDDEPETKSSTIMSRLDVSSRDSSAGGESSLAVKLEALLEITRSLGRALSLDEVLPQVLNTLFKVFTQADRGFIVLRRPDGTLEPRWTKVHHEDQGDTIRISRTIVSQVMDSREAVLSADAGSDERFEMSQSIADFRIRSVMCAPLVSSDNGVLGVLQVDTLNQRHRFQPTDLDVLASVAAQAAIAIENAQLHERVVQQRALDRELQLAQQVQQSFLPQSRPQLSGYQFSDFYQPANQIGGDFFDYVQLPDGRTAVIVADVVGHGIAAALLMAKLSSESRFCLATEQEPSQVVARLNAKLCDDNIDDRFVTMVLAVLHPISHEVTLVNAGHMAPMLCGRPGEVVEVGAEHSGLPLGVMRDIEYKQCHTTLEPGQIMVLFTDGLTEAVNPAGQLYGLERVRQHVANGSDSPEELVQRLVDDVRDFSQQLSPNDDMCVVCFSRV
jgi:serine phosphatase RsbU (regulator of sigma subunit)/pSer/pThr/pTyr-binding forkhead associated (FHA) protein